MGNTWKRQNPMAVRREKAREVYQPQKGTRRRVNALLS